jgi:hypothetical protein
VIVVTLDWFEIEMAAIVGVRRRVEARWRQGRVDLHPVPGEVVPSSNWETHVEGTIGEFVVAKALGRNWNGSINTYKVGGDVGPAQVRTRSDHEAKLIVRPRDRSTDYFVLVTGWAPTYHVHGWMLGADAKQERWLEDPGGRGAAYFVPQSELHPFPAPKKKELVAC